MSGGPGQPMSAVIEGQVGVAASKGGMGTGANVGLSSLQPTHYLTASRTQMQQLVNDIRINGIQESIKYVEHDGINYIVDGHHRFFAAQKLGLQTVPAQQVSLPYNGYKTIADLMLEGRMPGYWKYIK